MTQALVKAQERTICGECGGPVVCPRCWTGDVIAAAKVAVSEVVRGIGGRNAMARIQAARLVLAKDYLEHLSDADLLAEVKRRTGK